VQGCCPSNNKPAGKWRRFTSRGTVAVLLLLAFIGGAYLASTGENVGTSLNSFTDTVLEQVRHRHTISLCPHITDQTYKLTHGGFQLHVGDDGRLATHACGQLINSASIHELYGNPRFPWCQEIPDDKCLDEQSKARQQ
jgi:hypothetical protein